MSSKRSRARKKKHAKQIYCNPDVCPNCQYIGEGDSICDVTHEIVLSDWIPTDAFMSEGCVQKGSGANV